MSSAPHSVLVRDYADRLLTWRRFLPIQRVPSGRDRVLTGIPGGKRYEASETAFDLEDLPLPPGTEVEIHKDAYRAAHEWHERLDLETRERFLVHDDIDLAEVGAWDLYYHFTGQLLSLERLKWYIGEGARISGCDGDRLWNQATREIADSPLPIKDRVRFDLARQFDRFMLRPRRLSVLLGGSENGQSVASIPSTDVLVLVSGHSATLVAQSLERSPAVNRIGRFLFLGPSAAPPLKGHPTLSLASWIADRPYLDGKSSYEKEFANKVREAFASVPSLRTLRVALPGLLTLAQRRMRVSRFLVEAYKELLRSTEPELVVICGFEREWFSNALIQVCRRVGVPTLALQVADIEAIVPFQVSADLMTVQGQRARDHLVKGGVSADKLVVTGQPRYDTPMTVSRESLRSTHGIPDSTKLIVLASDPGTGFGSTVHKDRMERDVLEAVAKQSDTRLLVKLHPSDPGTKIQKMLEHHADPARLALSPPGLSAEDLMQMCDVWICAYSTTAQEAVAVGRPVLIANHQGEDFAADLVAAGLAGYFNSAESLGSALEETGTIDHTSDRGEAALEQRFNRLDGRSTERVAGVIEGLLSSSRTASKQRPF